MMLRWFTAFLLVVVAWSGASVADLFLRNDATFATALTGAAGSITNTMLADMAQATVKGRAAAAGTGAPGDLTQTQLTALINPATTALSGAVPAWPNNTTTFFRGDGTYAAPSIPLGRVLLNTLTASNSATLSDTTSLTATYPEYEIIFVNVLPATSTQNCEIQVHSGGSFQATSYLSNVVGASNTTASAASTTTFLYCSYGTTVDNTAPGISGHIRVRAVDGTSQRKQWLGSFTHKTGANNATMTSSGYWDGGNGAIDGFQVLMGSGNLTSGSVYVYGVQ